MVCTFDPNKARYVQKDGTKLPRCRQHLLTKCAFYLPRIDGDIGVIFVASLQHPFKCIEEKGKSQNPRNAQKGLMIKLFAHWPPSFSQIDCGWIKSLRQSGYSPHLFPCISEGYMFRSIEYCQLVVILGVTKYQVLLYLIPPSGQLSLQLYRLISKHSL